MTRIVIEDAVLFLFVFYMLSSIIFAMPIFDSFTPGQRYNSTTGSMEPYNRNVPSIFGDTTDVNATLHKYSNTSLIDPGAMLNPLAIVDMIRTYAGLLIDIVASTMLYHILKIFMGDALARSITFILNLMIVIVFIRVASGRIRWD